MGQKIIFNYYSRDALRPRSEARSRSPKTINMRTGNNSLFISGTLQARLAMMALFVFNAFLVPAHSILAHSSEKKNETIIHMTDTGFEPREVKINQGDTILFENTGKEPRWPASSIHPTHRIYPGSDINKCGTNAANIMFDACRSILPGESYTFQFNHVGTWRYHDHINATLTGTVSVSENVNVTGQNPQVPEPGKLETRSWWSNVTSFFRNLYNKLSSLIRKQAPAEQVGASPLNEPVLTDEEVAALRISDVVSDETKLFPALRAVGTARAMAMLTTETGGGSKLDCHQQAHNIGNAAYKIFGEEAFSECVAACHSGCYHGAMEDFLQKEGTQNLAVNIKRICESFATRFGVFECYHGVGHGLLAYLDYDLPEALRACDELGGSFEKTSCYGGVFMENIVTGQGNGAARDVHETKWVNRTDPHYPCNAVNQDYSVQYQCYQMQTSWMLTIYGYDFDRVAHECLRAPENMRAVCFKSYGRDAAGHTLRDPKKIVALCNKISDLPGTNTGQEESLNPYYQECVIGAVNVIVDFWGDGLKGQASELCSLFQAPYKKTCYTTLAGRLHELFKTPLEKQAVCETLEPEYHSLCSNQ